MNTIMSVGASFAVFMAADLMGHQVPILDALICAAAMIAAFLASEVCDVVSGP